MILLDTHVLIWLSLDVARVGAKAGRLADAALHRDELGISAFSFWEIAMLETKGRVRIGIRPEAIRRRSLEQGIREIPVDGATGIAAASLPHFHGDPADRIIAASAMAMNAVLLTADERFLGWRGGLKVQDARR